MFVHFLRTMNILHIVQVINIQYKLNAFHLHLLEHAYLDLLFIKADEFP